MAMISVIVPVYKVEPYLRKCVDSILGQTFRDFELILVDDGSPDNCGKICDEYAVTDSRVKVIHQQNGGLSAARNAGIDWMFANSDSEYVTFIDSDDWVESVYLERLYEGMTLGADVSCTGVNRVYPNGDVNKGLKDRGWRVSSPEDYWSLPDDMKDGAWAKLFKRKVLRDRFPVGKVSEEVYTTHRFVFSAKQVAVRYCPTYNYLMRPDSITTRSGVMHKRDMVDAIHAQYEYFMSRGFHSAACHTRCRECQFLLYASDAVKVYDAKLAQDFLHRAEDIFRKAKFPFWESRFAYRKFAPVKFLFMWPLAALWNALTRGGDSWLIRELFPMLRMMLLENRNAKRADGCCGMRRE